MANKDIVREREANPEERDADKQGGGRGNVVSEVMGHIIPWRKRRDGDFEALWDEFYAKWRGFWMPEHKSYKTERSKLISPLTSVSIDLTSAEIVEAIFGREYFIDLPDDAADEDSDDMQANRLLLCEDLKKVGFVEETGLSILNGCLYGTGIMKIEVSTRIRKKPFRTKDGVLQVEEREEVFIRPVSIDPGAFVGDPGCRSIDDMHGCAHEFQLPLHIIKQRQAEGIYWKDVKVGKWGKPMLAPNRGDTPEGNRREQGDVAFITEYYGKISIKNYAQAIAEAAGTPLSDEMVESLPESDMIEVIATIANEGQLLRVIENPLITGERLMASYQHELVPGRFWGRGVAEKGANVQRAMDAEMRARIDSLAWANNPMFAGDLTRLPPGMNKNAWPGKFWGVRGNPGEVISEFKLSGPDANSFQHMQDLERMGQQATGALDTPSLRAGIRDESATGSALAASGFIKRSKRTMFNIEEFMNKVIRRVTHLKMQYEPSRYKQDYEFQVRGTMGIMAREIEQQFMVDLARVIGPEHPASMPIIKAIFEHSGSPVKAEVLRALKAMEEKEPDPLEEAAKRAALENPILENEKLKAEVFRIGSEGELKQAQKEKTEEETENIDDKQIVEEIRVLNDLKETDNQQRQMDIQEEKLDIEREKVRKQSSTK